MYVSNVTYNPGSMYDGDKATVDIKVTNGNTDTEMIVNHAQLSDDTIRTVSRPYDSSSNIDPVRCGIIFSKLSQIKEKANITQRFP